MDHPYTGAAAAVVEHTKVDLVEMAEVAAAELAELAAAAELVEDYL